MGLRVRKSVQICKGVKLNVGSTGVSLSLGTNGLRHTIHSSGRRTSTVGIPGSGISYSKRHSNKKKQNVIQKSQQQSRDSKDINERKVQEYNNLIQTLTSIHKTCDEYVDWKAIHKQGAEEYPGGIGPKQAKANEDLKNYRPRLFQANRRVELEKAIERAAIEDAEDEKNRMVLLELAKRVLDGDIDAYLGVISEMNPLDDLLDFGSDFEFGSDKPTAMEVEFRAKTDRVVPQFSLSLTKTGQLSKKDLTKTAYFELMQDFVCSCAIRIARDIFALLPVDTVVVHTVEDRVNTETGQQEDMTILSVLFDRETLYKLNMERIDPSDAMNNFGHNMRFLKTAGFKPVDRIENY